MDRVVLTLAVLAFFLLCLWGMRRGWRRRARAQSVRVPPFPRSPDEPGTTLLPAAEGLYISTTTAGDWQDRVVTRGAGVRGPSSWRLYPGGIDVRRNGAPDFWIPLESIVDIRTDSAIAGKVMGTQGLLVVTWRAGEVLLDTGFRGDDIGVYPQWIGRVKNIIARDESTGGAQ